MAAGSHHYVFEDWLLVRGYRHTARLMGGESVPNTERQVSVERCLPKELNYSALGGYNSLSLIALSIRGSLSISKIWSVSCGSSRFQSIVITP